MGKQFVTVAMERETRRILRKLACEQEISMAKLLNNIVIEASRKYAADVRGNNATQGLPGNRSE